MPEVDILQAIVQDKPSLLEKCFSKYEEKLLEEKCGKVGSIPIVHKACGLQKVLIIEFLSKKAQSTPWLMLQFTSKGPENMTALHYAFSGFRDKVSGRKVYMDIKKFVKIVAIFHETEISLESVDDGGCTVLHKAAGSLKNLDGVRMLIHKGANFMALDNKKQNLLHHAAKQTKLLKAVTECLSMIKKIDHKILLLQQQNKDGTTPSSMLSKGRTELDDRLNRLIETRNQMSTAGWKAGSSQAGKMANNAGSKDLSEGHSSTEGKRKRPMKAESSVIKKAKLGTALGGISPLNDVETSSGANGSIIIAKPKLMGVMHFSPAQPVDNLNKIGAASVSGL